jgi:hypothetical protein
MHNIAYHCILHCHSRQTNKEFEVNKLCNKENCKITIYYINYQGKTHVFPY